MAYDAQPTGVLANLCEQTWVYANEPSLRAKYTTAKLFPIFKAVYRMMIADIIRVSVLRPTVKFNFSFDSSSVPIILPANCGIIERIYKLNDETGLPETMFFTRSRDSVAGPIFRFEGNMMRPLPNWQYGTDNLVLEYVPNGDLDLALGTMAANDSGNSTTSWALDTTPDEGYFDRRPNVYLGNCLNLLSCGSSPSGYTFFPIQKRIITGYTANPGGGAKPKVTFDTPLDFTPSTLSTAAVTYEIVPSELDSLTTILAIRTAIFIHNVEGNAKRAALLQVEYEKQMGNIKQAVAELDSKRGERFEHDSTYSMTDLWGLVQ